MVKFGNNWNVFEEYDGDLLSILDFPLESLEEDGFVGDWDINSSSNVLGPPTLRTNMIDMGPTCLYPGPVAPIARAPEREQLSNHFDASGSCIRQRNKFANIQESVAFEGQSPVSVLESSGSCFGGMSLSIKPDHTIPVRSRSKRVRPMGGMNPWRLASPLFSSSQKTLNARRTIESKKKSFQYPVAVDFMKDSSKKVMSPLPVLDGASLRNAYSHRLVVIKKCSHCESTKTPQWREGPMGPKTLCNACGVRYRTGRLFPEYRPASSPSFVPSKHSNSHKKVIEMRNKAKLPEGKIKLAPISPQPKAKTEESPLSPQPEFVPMSSYLFDYIS